jgi:hypothetical protein
MERPEQVERKATAKGTALQRSRNAVEHGGLVDGGGHSPNR